MHHYTASMRFLLFLLVLFCFEVFLQFVLQRLLAHMEMDIGLFGCKLGVAQLQPADDCLVFLIRIRNALRLHRNSGSDQSLTHQKILYVFNKTGISADTGNCNMEIIVQATAKSGLFLLQKTPVNLAQILYLLGCDAQRGLSGAPAPPVRCGYR